MLTACSKSPDMPIDSSHSCSVIPSALQTSVLQFNSVCFVQNTEKKNELEENQFKSKRINSILD